MDQWLGMKMPQETNTILFIPKIIVTAGRTVNYGIIVSEIQPKNSQTHITQLTVVGNIILFPGNFTITTEDLTTSKLLLVSLLST